MSERKTFQELTIKDNFMFGAVMCDEEKCRQFLEMVLQMPIGRLEISREKCMIYNPQYKGVRLDVFAKDGKNTCYNVEMQVMRESEPGKRSRYYHSQIDMELLLKGMDYGELPNAYVIFICDYDPFGGRKYCYTFEKTCLEHKGAELKDGARSIFLSTRGENPEEVPEGMVKFLEFARADLPESEKDYQDSFVKSLQEAIRYVKQNRQMEERYMLLELEIKRERREAKAEGVARGKAEDILELLGELGVVPEDLQEHILQEKDLDVLKKWFKLAAKAVSVEEFRCRMQEL